MALELQFGTNIRTAIQLIEDGEVNPIIDFDGTRYLIEPRPEIGTIHWTPFDLTTQQIIGTKKFKYPYAAHNVLAEGILGPSSRSYSEDATITTFPNFPVPLDNGFVIP